MAKRPTVCPTVPPSPQHQKQPPFMGATAMATAIATSTSTSSTNRDNPSVKRLDRTPWWTSDAERGLGFGESEGFELAETGLEVGGREGAVDGEGGAVDRGDLLEDVEVRGLGNEVFHCRVIGVR
ncbi:hypothetical protein NL676_020105 [Syzygium grande]|nr:hypothetical protein NL676_020105 [Syzygium grande]